MKCPLCQHRTFSAGVLSTVEEQPGRKEVSQRRVCSNPKCNHHFKVEIVYKANVPDPPEAA